MHAAVYLTSQSAVCIDLLQALNAMLPSLCSNTAGVITDHQSATTVRSRSTCRGTKIEERRGARRNDLEDEHP
jgi:hypothetical protein